MARFGYASGELIKLPKVPSGPGPGSEGYPVRSKTMKVTVSSPMTLEDLRWLVEQCQGEPGSCRVVVTGAKEYSQLDSDPATITVHL